jgi:hypothetical protein
MRKNKFQVQTAACEVMACGFRYSEGILVVEFLKRCATISSVTCADIGEVRTTNSKGSVKQEGESSSHSACSTHLAFSDFHCIDTLKNALRGRCFADDNELKCSVHEEFLCFSKEFCDRHTRLMQRWEK